MAKSTIKAITNSWWMFILVYILLLPYLFFWSNIPENQLTIVLWIISISFWTGTILFVIKRKTENKSVIETVLVIAGLFALLHYGSIHFLDQNKLDSLSELARDDETTYLIETYVAPIKTNDLELRRQAADIVKTCKSGNEACYVHEIYEHVIDNYNYYADPMKDEFVQNPYETIKVKGGDCEDLTILMNSLLENIGIETYVVLTDEHAYSVACGLNLDDLEEQIINGVRKKLFRNFEEELDVNIIMDGDQMTAIIDHEHEIMLEPFKYTSLGGDGQLLIEPYPLLDVEYMITSTYPISTYLVPTEEDIAIVDNPQKHEHYVDCSYRDTTQYSTVCKGLDRNAILVISNEGYSHKPSKVSVKAKYVYRLSFENTILDYLREGGGINYYLMGEQTCVVLDPTLGEDGFPGYDVNLKAKNKIAIHTVTKETYQNI